MKTLELSRSEIFVGQGLLGDAADQAETNGFRFVSVQGKVFRLEPGRARGSSLGLSRVQAKVAD